MADEPEIVGEKSSQVEKVKSFFTSIGFGKRKSAPASATSSASTVQNDASAGGDTLSQNSDASTASAKSSKQPASKKTKRDTTNVKPAQYIKDYGLASQLANKYKDHTIDIPPQKDYKGWLTCKACAKPVRCLTKAVEEHVGVTASDTGNESAESTDKSGRSNLGHFHRICLLKWEAKAKKHAGWHAWAADSSEQLPGMCRRSFSRRCSNGRDVAQHDFYAPSASCIIYHVTMTVMPS
jgi:hypothetical protein